MHLSAAGLDDAAIVAMIESSPTAFDTSVDGVLALEAHYRFILWLVPAVERFPRNRKFRLGDRIQTVALDVQEQVIGSDCIKHHTIFVCAGAETPAQIGYELLKRRRVR